MKITQIGWRAMIDGKEYGNDLDLGSQDYSSDLKHAAKFMIENMIESVSKIMTGKSESERMIEEATKKYDEYDSQDKTGAAQ